MPGTGIGGHHRSPLAHMRHQSDEWLTPLWLIDRLGPFDLDPCTPDVMPWQTASRRYTRADDGLSAPWAGMVWLNPPYGRQTGRWLARLADHGHGIALIFARTETSMFQRHVFARAHGMLFLSGRLDFRRADGQKHAAAANRRNANAGGPSVLVAYGRDAWTRLSCACLPGALVQAPLVVPGVCRDLEARAKGGA